MWESLKVDNKMMAEHLVVTTRALGLPRAKLEGQQTADANKTRSSGSSQTCPFTLTGRAPGATIPGESAVSGADTFSFFSIAYASAAKPLY